MDIHADHELPLRGQRPTAVTIGAYDGVHLGHRAILASVRERAARDGLETVVITFDRHPAEVVRPDSAPRLLTDLEQKLELLATTGIDHAVVVRFDEERAKEPAEDFVEEVIGAGLAARQVVVGEDFHFGHLRQGNVALLTEMGHRLGFEVLGHHLVGADGTDARDDTQVSSTAIRRALVEGRLADANAMLGRPHEMRGPVVAGDRRGRELGFPTANVAVPERMLMPADGIYAGWLGCYDPDDGSDRSGPDQPGPVQHDTAWWPAAIYVGHRPTFYDEGAGVLLEVHVLDFEGDLYGRHVRVRFTDRLREDRRFDDVEALAEQLRRDVDEARRLLTASVPVGES
ncbi:MAG TPA: bifunctional riboflavin kinase/FAD synthetase [Microthrixaceae bacterium]|nr:bifunctional riboflavin kinase/FAD synthetase [Microthrixaceae bacterium]